MLIGSSSTKKPKKSLSGYINKEYIEGEGSLVGVHKDLIFEEIQEYKPLEISNPPLVLNPNNTLFTSRRSKFR